MDPELLAYTFLPQSWRTPILGGIAGGIWWFFMYDLFTWQYKAWFAPMPHVFVQILAFVTGMAIAGAGLLLFLGWIVENRTREARISFAQDLGL